MKKRKKKKKETCNDTYYGRKPKEVRAQMVKAKQNGRANTVWELLFLNYLSEHYLFHNLTSNDT